MTIRHNSESPLVAVAELAAHGGDPDWVVVDCRFDLMDPDAGRRAWLAGHIPGACYADLEHDLAGTVASDGSGGRHPLPERIALSRRFRAWGINRSSRVVAYDDAGNAFAARLWWLLRWMGHSRAAVLDGGLPAWQAAGQPLSAEPVTPESGNFDGEPGAMPVVDAAAVASGLAAGTMTLLDARAAARFAGKSEPLDRRAGHVPGAINTPFSDNLLADKCFRPAAELRAYYRAAVAGEERGATRAVTTMCGSGVTACHTLLALEIAGLPGAALYAGSWSDWISREDRPAATAADEPN